MSGATIGADFLDGSKRPNVDALCTKLVAALKERHTRAGGGVDSSLGGGLAIAPDACSLRMRAWMCGAGVSRRPSAALPRVCGPSPAA